MPVICKETPNEEKMLAERFEVAHWIKVIKTVPARQLPNIRIVVEIIGDHIVIKLTGKKIGIGSI